MRICIAVNKSRGTFGPSETFIRAHATQLEGVAGVIVGNPLNRRSGAGHGSPLQSLTLAARGIRLLARRLGLSTSEKQDKGALLRYLRKLRPDVVLAEYGHTATSVLGACRAMNIPLVAHFHGWDAFVLPHDPQVRAEYGSLFAYAAKVIAVSRHMVDELVALGARRDQIAWNPCGAELPSEDLTARPEKASPKFVSVGTMRLKKAQTGTLLAFSRILKEVPDATLELLGGGPMLEYQRQLADFLGIARQVSFHGVVDHDFVFERLRAARCYVHPSVRAENGDCEGTPVSVLEAMAVGLPVIGTRHGGIPDVVRDGQTGFLVPEYDVGATAQAMARYGNDARLAALHGGAGRRDVADHWSMSSSLARLSAILEEATARSHGHLS